MDINDLRGITTLMSLLAFVAVVVWAYSKRRKGDFHEAANQLFKPEEEAMHKRSIQEADK
ncbi:MAG: cbb3-type cytochrome oxidase subunit 3 [bacterium]